MSPANTPELGSSSGLYMTAEEAARALNVSVPTLYTYVSRKNIRAHRTRGSRSSRYLRSDIEQLKAGISLGSSRESTPGLTDSSAITLVTEAGSFYRGQSAVHLADSASLEEVSRLLWQSEDFDPFDQPPPKLPPQWNALLRASAECSALDRATMLLPAIEAANPRAHDLSKQGFQRSGADVLRWFTALMLGKEAPPERMPLHRYIAVTTRCGSKLEDAVRRVLVLSADQGLHPATYVVRAAANTGATPYRCVIAGLCAAMGRRLPAVRATSFARFLAEIDAASDPTEPVRTRIRENEDVPGFGFSPFDAPDPRAAALLASLRSLLCSERGFARFEKAIDLACDLTGKQPEFAFLAAYVNRRIGAAPDANLVRLGRIAGWVAHAWEQQGELPVVHWKVNYRGVLP